MLRLPLFLLACLTAFPVMAQENNKPFNESGYAVPRFVSLRAGQVYARTGPGKQYPVRYVYQRKSMPVEVVLEYEGWRKVRDIQGAEGWVHGSLLSGKRSAIVKQQIKLRKKPARDSRATAIAEAKTIVQLEKCIKGNWCRVSAAGYKGWIERKYLWGVYENEFFD